MAAYGRVRLVRAVKTGAVFTKATQNYTANASGVLTFTATQGATIYLFGNTNGLDANGPQGVAVTVPSAATANLEDLL